MGYNIANVPTRTKVGICAQEDLFLAIIARFITSLIFHGPIIEQFPIDVSWWEILFHWLFPLEAFPFQI